MSLLFYSVGLIIGATYSLMTTLFALLIASIATLISLLP